MKLIYILIPILLLEPKSVFPQVKANFGIGYNVGTHLKTEGLGFVIGRYNDTRSYLTKRMKEPRFFKGLVFNTEMYFPKGLMDFEYIFRNSEVSAEADTVRRDLRYRVNSFNFGYGMKLNSKKSGPAGPYLGMDFSTISTKTYTRVYQIGEDKPDFTKLHWDLGIGFSPFFQYVGGIVTAKLYYQFMIIKLDYWHENMALNPNTWSADSFENIKGKTSSIGICLRFNLVNNNK